MARTKTTAARQQGERRRLGLSSSYEIIDGLSVGAYASSNRTASQKAGTFGKGDKADIWAAGMKYDNNDVHRCHLLESRNIAPISGTATINNRSTSVSGFANKAEGPNWLRNISSISVCAHRWATFSRKAKILKASAMPTS